MIMPQNINLLSSPQDQPDTVQNHVDDPREKELRGQDCWTCVQSSTEPGQDISVHQDEPGIDDTPNREGPSSRSDLCLIYV